MHSLVHDQNRECNHFVQLHHYANDLKHISMDCFQNQRELVVIG